MSSKTSFTPHLSSMFDVTLDTNRLAKIYRIAFLRYNQSKSNEHETANDESVASTSAALTHNADTDGAGAGC